MASIVMNNLTKSYDGEYKAVNNANLEIDEKEFCVLLGPSGCGKTTLLRMIAGLETITDGDLYLDGVHLNQVLPKDRNIAMVFQSYALYPHYSVYKNMAFGLKMKKIQKEEIDKRIKKAAEYLDLTEYLDRKPRNLSGGQQQRVALGRALVKQTKVFLMDEPLSNLDAKLRQQTRETIVKIHEDSEATTLYVTHDQVEAMTMGTKIVVMNRGVIQQMGTPEQIYEEPNNDFVAGFIGSPSINFIEGIVEEDSFISEDIKLKLTENQKDLLSDYQGKNVKLGIRPEHLYNEEDVKEDMFVSPIKMKINFIERLGAETILNGQVGSTRIVGKLAYFLKKALTDIELQVDMTKAHFFDMDTKEAIR
ncbi:ABC transporter ATP-binding protein [Acidaminobacter sp. JC074]|uniref:ABC transporter ATP-binding protein n=1 Tax=Acidaminobacter sp. JC074 TaxID=2530199 RepID=UPI001F113F1E|nr:ABC transporter ATP-binding protein [Acidaminobacter sp. JC074]MCH4890140.1 ABC transporter ATP-binding protein [Acidaminobacter sp. JC074]